MKTLFPVSFFENNRANLKKLFKGTAPIVISANGLLQRNGDTTYPFRQDSSFWYLTGIDVPGAILVMDKAKEYLILPTLHEYAEIFDGEISLDIISARSGIEIILDEENGWKQLSARLKRSKHVATLAPSPDYVDGLGFYTNPARSKTVSKIKGYNAELKILDLRAHLIKLRVIKQPPEIAAIEAAIDITRQTLKKIQKNIKNYEHEYDIDAFVLSEFRKKNSKPSFDSVIACGKNAATIHHMGGESKLDHKALLLLDMGAEVENYCADISRTYSINNNPTKRQKQIYASVIEAQNYAYSLIKPGIIPKEYEADIEHYMGEQLRSLGLIKTIDKKSVRRYYPHLMSHFLGLDPHDVGDYKQPLQPNMIITVEPGFYIPEEGIGVRVEDDVLITEDGFRILSDNLPSLVN